ncbi:MAG: hypothetical protein EB015_16920 [Methylocystaceae bacterium]|nr:hypothetical protein [Methylocystaceae bacterium]
MLKAKWELAQENKTHNQLELRPNKFAKSIISSRLFGSKQAYAPALCFGRSVLAHKAFEPFTLAAQMTQPCTIAKALF